MGDAAIFSTATPSFRLNVVKIWFSLESHAILSLFKLPVMYEIILSFNEIRNFKYLLQISLSRMKKN